MNHKPAGFGRGHPTQLPKAHIDWLIQPVSRFIKIEAAAGAVLLMTALAHWPAISSSLKCALKI